MAELATILRLSENDSVRALRRDLLELCAQYPAILANLPCDLPNGVPNISLTKRADWLESNVINPCERLGHALAVDMRPMFSTWPYPLTTPKFRDNRVIVGELNDLISLATDLRDSLRGQQSDDAGHSQEFRAEVFAAIARALRAHCPTMEPNRGTYDPELKRRIGPYVDAMRLIFRQVTGVSENLDRLIRGEIGMPS